MPTQTFFNLPEDKKQKIIDASKNEFSKYNFYDASINRIIKEAGIARGSFYQYFEYKEDLFIYILDQYKEKLVKALSKNIENSKYDIFELFILMYDYITVDSMESEDREFIITTVSNIDVKLMNHLLAFLSLEDISKDLEHISQLVDMEKLKVNNLSEFMYIKEILINIMMSQVVMFFNNRDNAKKCREDMINKFNLIKYGVMK